MPGENSCVLLELRLYDLKGLCCYSLDLKWLQRFVRALKPQSNGTVGLTLWTHVTGNLCCKRTVASSLSASQCEDGHRLVGPCVLQSDVLSCYNQSNRMTTMPCIANHLTDSVLKALTCRYPWASFGL